MSAQIDYEDRTLLVHLLNSGKTLRQHRNWEDLVHGHTNGKADKNRMSGQDCISPQYFNAVRISDTDLKG